MRRTYILLGAIVAAALAALLTTRVTTLELTNTRATPQPVSIDIMEMMSKAKDLPVQAYDAI